VWVSGDGRRIMGREESSGVRYCVIGDSGKRLYIARPEIWEWWVVRKVM
jgi:hypothetical protein